MGYKAIIIIPLVVVGVPIVVILLCVLKSYCCNCCDDDKPKPPKWNRKNRAPVNQDLTTKAQTADGDKKPNEFANSVLATMGDEPEKYREEQTHYRATYMSESQPECDEQGYNQDGPAEASGGCYGEGAYPQQPGYDTLGHNPDEKPSSAGSGSKLSHGSPARNQVEPQIPKKKRSRRQKYEQEEKF